MPVSTVFKQSVLSWMVIFAMASCGDMSYGEKTGPISTLDSLEKELRQVEESGVLPGFALAIFTADSIIYGRGFGYANLERKEAYTVDHFQIIASVSKTLTGIALMQAVEDSLVRLDDPVEDYLDYPVVNPAYPEVPITLRMLAAHTSSLSGTEHSDKGYRFDAPLLKSDFPEAYESLLADYNKTEELSLDAFLQRKLDPNGMWFERGIYTEHMPGTQYEYSNYGIALLALIVEKARNTSFSDLTEQAILLPLHMNRSSWELPNSGDGPVVTYYNELYHEVPPYSIITYPDGGLYSSVADMTIYLQHMMKGYSGSDSTLLLQPSYREMMRRQFEGDNLTDGLCWDLSFDHLIGHSGNDFGTATLMYFAPETGIGRILFTNISIETAEQEEAFYGIYNTLFDYDFEIEH